MQSSSFKLWVYPKWQNKNEIVSFGRGAVFKSQNGRKKLVLIVEISSQSPTKSGYSRMVRYTVYNVLSVRYWVDSLLSLLMLTTNLNYHFTHQNICRTKAKSWLGSDTTVFFRVLYTNTVHDIYIFEKNPSNCAFLLNSEALAITARLMQAHPQDHMPEWQFKMFIYLFGVCVCVRVFRCNECRHLDLSSSLRAQYYIQLAFHFLQKYLCADCLVYGFVEAEKCVKSCWDTLFLGAYMIQTHCEK